MVEKESLLRMKRLLNWRIGQRTMTAQREREKMKKKTHSHTGIKYAHDMISIILDVLSRSLSAFQPLPPFSFAF